MAQYGPAKGRNMPGTQIEEKIVSIANNVLLLYSTSPRLQTFDDHYEDHAVFSCPLVHIKGKENIKKQFALLPIFFSSIKVKDSTIFVNEHQNQIVMDTLQEFRPRFLPFFTIVLRLVAVLTLAYSGEAGDKIAKHEDIWSFHSVLCSFLPFGIGSVLYNVVFRAVAAWFFGVIAYLLDYAQKVAKPTTRNMIAVTLDKARATMKGTAAMAEAAAAAAMPTK